MPKDEKEFTPEELAKFNGKGGQPAYLAYRGRVYDISASPLWPDGEHMVSHLAGGDLTGEFSDAPHGEEVFERYPQVGVLRTDPASAAPVGPGLLTRLLQRFPLLKRHPHPMVVHFPIVFFISTPAFTILSLLTGVKSFEVTSFHCLGGGILFTPVAMVTGLLTWWFNYQWRPLRPVVIKLILTPILLTVGAAAFTMRWLDPEILAHLGHWTGKFYLGMILVLGPLVSTIGWYGASLTFPRHEE